jgi:hypothetical protein
MLRKLLVNTHYVLISMYMSFWPALAVGLLVHFIEPEWEVIAFGAVFSYVLTEFLFRYKGKWL